MSDSRLNKLIMHACNTVPYYKDLFSDMGINAESIKCTEDLKKIPILTKKEVQRMTGRFVSSDCLQYPKNENLIIRRTSGSTGMLLKVFWTRHDYIRSLFPLWVARRQYYGIEPDMKSCTFHTGMMEEEGMRISEISFFNSGRILSFSKHKLDKDQLTIYYNEMLAFDPEWMMLQPSVAYLLACFMTENHLEKPSGMRYMELTGEYLFDTYRSKIKEAFGIPVINQYGCEELNSIAMECPCGNMHCLGDNAIVEVIKDGRPANFGEAGEIHVTGLNNYTMPFIRYSLGDRGVLFPSDICSCGSRNPVIKVLAGRTGDFILVDGREPINSYIFYNAIETINRKNHNVILQFQVTQVSNSDFEVKLVLKHASYIPEDIIIKQFTDCMSTMGLNNVNWKFIFMDSIIPHPTTGKLSFFNSNICEEAKYAAI